MKFFLILLCVILIPVILIQIGKIKELAATIRGEKEAEAQSNRANGSFMLVFLVGFLIFCVASALYYKNYMLGYGPHVAASEHGPMLDSLFNVTLFFTGIVFVITHILLFYFAWKYQQKEGRVAAFISHDNKLEVIWTAIPAVVMTFLVVGGLDAWNEVTRDVTEEQRPSLYASNEGEYINIEATGYQFAWHLRYPGADGRLGATDFKKIKSGVNEIGQDWYVAVDKDGNEDVNYGLDDFYPAEIVLPVGKEVRVRVRARDVLHNFALPHFRNKMDAVPGMPTYVRFTPTVTTEQYRKNLSEYPEYQVPDPDDPEKMRWETFDYELACQELCGTGHYSMRRLVKIVSEEEYAQWVSEQQSYYFSQIRDTDADPNLGRLLSLEINQRKQELKDKVSTVLMQSDSVAKIVQFKYVTFNTGSYDFDTKTIYELDALVDILKNKYPTMVLEMAGHTDDVGDDAGNMVLSQNRADAVRDYLVKNGISSERITAVGYGETRFLFPDNATPVEQAENRRTEFEIKSK